MSSLVIISVVRDYAMYERCIGRNRFLSKARLVAIDNREKNEGVSVLYNRFIDGYDYSTPAWFVFCHEDFEIKERISDVLNVVSPESLFSPVGTSVKNVGRWLPGGVWRGCIHGVFESGDKVNSSIKKISVNPLSAGTCVDVFDCMCLIVHSSLVRQHHLRFDPALTFDLYVEDFCMAAKDKYGIHSRILPFKCCHRSVGTILPRFFAQLRYLRRKYPNVDVFCTVGYFIGGGRSLGRKIQLRILDFLHDRIPWVPKMLAKLI